MKIAHGSERVKSCLSAKNYSATDWCFNFRLFEEEMEIKRDKAKHDHLDH